ncbi:MAG: hypothetical protein J6W84_06330 [Bacteroidales bacterium]|nr:hypothetical protein [Bacteroidales bacterium]
MKGQRADVLKWLQNGNSITNWQAFKLFGTTRLGAIIYDLRKMGYKIKTIIMNGENCQFAVYVLSTEE